MSEEKINQYISKIKKLCSKKLTKYLEKDSYYNSKLKGYDIDDSKYIYKSFCNDIDYYNYELIDGNINDKNEIENVLKKSLKDFKDFEQKIYDSETNVPEYLLMSITEELENEVCYLKKEIIFLKKEIYNMKK